jgi:hypothetical protein
MQLTLPFASHSATSLPMRTRILALLFATCVALALSASALAADAVSGIIKVAKVTGSVSMTIKATGTVTKLSDDSFVSEGAIVTTEKDSSVILVFSNGATVNLVEDSELDIAKFTQDPFNTSFSPSQSKAEPTTSVTRLKLVHGDLVTKVLKLNIDRGSEFVVQTPVGAAGIRGTIFRIIYRVNPATGSASYSLVALEGRVHVTLATGTVSAPVDVSAGNQVTISAKVSIDAGGNVTVTTPAGQTTTLVTKASTATIQQVAASANVITQAVANVVLLPPAASTQQAAPPPAPVTNTSPLVQPINPAVVSPSH